LKPFQAGEAALAACLRATSTGGGVQSCVGLGGAEEVMHAAANLPGVRMLLVRLVPWLHELAG
jgi:hypothetical protein